MSWIFLAVSSWVLGTTLCYTLGISLWWLSAWSLIPLLMGIGVGYVQGKENTTEYYRNLMRNQN